MTRLKGMGFGFVVSSGNEATVDTTDYLDFLSRDDETHTVVLYLEQIRGGAGFLRACRNLRDQGKTVLVLKAGASEAGATVAFGHTGSLVGSHSAFLAAAGSSGVAVAQGLDELVALVRMASDAREASRQIVGLSMSGGLNGLMADAATRAGVEFSPLSEATVDRLREVVPISSSTNPFDLTGLAVDRPGVLAQVLDVLEQGTSAREFVFSLGLMPDATWPEWSTVCAEFVQRTGVRLSLYAASGRRPGDGYESFERLGMKVYETIEPMLRALSALDDAAATSKRVEPVLAPAAARVELPEDLRARREVLGTWEVPYVPYAYVTSADEAVAAASDMQGTVAMKIASELVAHKAKLGLIILDVATEAQARAAFDKIAANFTKVRDLHPDAPLELEVQQMLPRGGLECFLGGTVDPTFGPVVTVGLGGVMVEAIAEVGSALAPLDSADAARLIASVRGLDAALGDGLDRGALATVVSRFSHMLVAMQSVVDEVECNPVVVFEQGAYVVDDLWTGKGA
jgi:acyl-CoA synthetase (NDP forming)